MSRDNHQLLPRLRAGKCCRLCGGTSGLTRHHLVPNRMRRKDESLSVPENLVWLCGECHRLVEAKVKSGGLVHRARLRASLTADELLFVRRRAKQWFDLNYPLAVEGDR